MLEGAASKRRKSIKWRIAPPEIIGEIRKGNLIDKHDEATLSHPERNQSNGDLSSGETWSERVKKGYAKSIDNYSSCKKSMESTEYIRCKRNSKYFEVTKNVYSLGIYYVKNDERHDEYSNMILRLKNRNLQAVDYFKKTIIEDFNDKFPKMLFCSVPSSDKTKLLNGMQMLTREIIGHFEGLDGTSCLYRLESIQPAHLGGSRSKWLQKRTIGVQGMDLLKSKQVVLLDDIYTTGASFEACRELLLENGANSVTGIVLGRTAEKI